MGHLGYLIGGVLIGPVLVVAIGFILAFPWHFAALLAVALVVIFAIALTSVEPFLADTPTAPRDDPARKAVDLLKPGQ